MDENNKAVLDEMAKRIKETCDRCPDKLNCPQRKKGFNEIINCAIGRYKEFKEKTEIPEARR